MQGFPADRAVLAGSSKRVRGPLNGPMISIIPYGSRITWAVCPEAARAFALCDPGYHRASVAPRDATPDSRFRHGWFHSKSSPRSGGLITVDSRRSAGRLPSAPRSGCGRSGVPLSHSGDQRSARRHWSGKSPASGDPKQDRKEFPEAIAMFALNPQDIEALHSGLVTFFLDTMTEVELVVPTARKVCSPAFARTSTCSASRTRKRVFVSRSRRTLAPLPP